MPWNSEIERVTLARAEADGATNNNLPLKLGVFWSDGIVAPHPPVTRGLHLLQRLLKANGHKVPL